MPGGVGRVVTCNGWERGGDGRCGRHRRWLDGNGRFLMHACPMRAFWYERSALLMVQNIFAFSPKRQRIWSGTSWGSGASLALDVYIDTQGTGKTKLVFISQVDIY